MTTQASAPLMAFYNQQSGSNVQQVSIVKKNKFTPVMNYQKNANSSKVQMYANSSTIQRTSAIPSRS